MIIKPNKRSYIFSLVLVDIIAVLFFWVIIWSLSNFSLFIITIIPFIIYILYGAFNAYSKEEYRLEENELKFNIWWVLNEKDFNLNYQNIKNISLEIPLWQRLFFNTWNIIIKQKNSDNPPIKLLSVNYPKKIIQNIIKNSEKLNFTDHEKILLEAKLNNNSLDLDFIIRLTAISLFFIIYMLFINKTAFFWFSQNFMLVLWVWLFVAFWWYIFCRHNDLKNRKYIIFENWIYFTEWSLIIKHFLIPVRWEINIDYKREFIEKLFWEWCSIEEKTVYFKTLFSWKDLVENIKSLQNISKTENSNIETTYFYPNKTKTILLIWARSVIWILAMSLIPNEFNILEFILLTLILFKIWLIFIRNIWYYFVFNKKFFRVKHNFLEFLNHKLETEKITSVIFSENLIDKLLWTYTITFWALETDEPIQFSNIKKSLILKEYITKLLDIKKETTKYNITSNFKVSNYIKSRIYIILWNLLIIILLSIILVLVKNFILLQVIIFSNILFYILKIWYDFSHSKTAVTHFKPSYIYHKSWIIKQEEFFISYKNVNDLCSTQYIATHNWKLSFDISWERVITTPYGQIKLPNKLDLNFIEDVFKARNALENLIREEEVWVIENSYYTKSEVKNEILKYILWSLPIVTIPLVLPFAIYDILHTWVKSYYIKWDKIIEKTWIINQREVSILISKIKDVKIKRWFLERYFNNANIEIITIWEWISNLELKYIKNYKELYNKINEILIAEAKEYFDWDEEDDVTEENNTENIEEK